MKNFVITLCLGGIVTFSVQAIDVHVFQNYRGTGIRNMELIGQVISKGVRINQTYNPILKYDLREQVITVRVLTETHLRIGDTIYIVKKHPSHERYKSSFIVAEGEVFSIFKTEFQGLLLKAKGFFSNVEQGHFIVRDKIEGDREQAHVLLRKGDRARLLKNYAKALSFYQKSLEHDKQRPETYLKLATISKELNLHTKAGNYIEQAWKRRNKFEDTNTLLKLPGLYLAWQTENLQNPDANILKSIDCSYAEEDNKFVCKTLKLAVYVLDEIRGYQKRLGLLEHTLPQQALELLHSKGVPDYEFQFYFARLFLFIRDTLKKYSPSKIVFWLRAPERKILYEKIKMVYTEQKHTDPRKAWDMAYLEAGIYHLQIAEELNSLDPRAAIRIVRLCYDELRQSPPRRKREKYLELSKHYGKKLKNMYQLKGYNWDAVKNILDAVSGY